MYYMHTHKDMERRIGWMDQWINGLDGWMDRKRGRFFLCATGSCKQRGIVEMVDFGSQGGVPRFGMNDSSCREQCLGTVWNREGEREGDREGQERRRKEGRRGVFHQHVLVLVIVEC